MKQPNFPPCSCAEVDCPREECGDEECELRDRRYGDPRDPDDAKICAKLPTVERNCLCKNKCLKERLRLAKEGTEEGAQDPDDREESGELAEDEAALEEDAGGEEQNEEVENRETSGNSGNDNGDNGGELGARCGRWKTRKALSSSSISNIPRGPPLRRARPAPVRTSQLEIGRHRHISTVSELALKGGLTGGLTGAPHKTTHNWVPLRNHGRSLVSRDIFSNRSTISQSIGLRFPGKARAIIHSVRGFYQGSPPNRRSSGFRWVRMIGIDRNDIETE